MTAFARGQQISGDEPNRVTNQPAFRVDLDEYAVNAPLRNAVTVFGAGWAHGQLHDAGRHVGTLDFQRDAHHANVNRPMAHILDRWGFRLDEVEYDPAYHRVLAAAIARGAHASDWAEPQTGAAVARAAMFMLFAQIEPGHSCPVSMTHAAVAPIRATPGLAEAWLPRILSRSYEPRLLADELKSSALIGMAMTERQGGSDVRANSTEGVHLGGNQYAVTGHKWFCSAPMSDAFLVLAQTRRGTLDEGLSCLFVPRVMTHGSRNAFQMQRLKDKLGNHSNASAEIELRGAVGTLIGEPGNGVRAIIDMVQLTRLDCVLGAAAGMRQSVAEALWHTRGRQAFGAALVAQPAMTAVLADLALESEAAMLLGLRLAQAFDEGASEREVLFRRLATPIAKYWVTKRGPHHAYEALECLGGNGYTESFPLARRYREQPVMAIWEGSGNVIALDVLRAMTREPETVAALADELAVAAGESRLLDQHVARTLRRVDELGDLSAREAQASARGVAEALALALQGSLMLRHAPLLDAETFLAARLGEDRAAQYGVLPHGADAARIVARH